MSSILGAPTLAGYSNFLYQTAQIPVSALPTNSFAITLSFNIAMGIVSCQLMQIDPDLYTICVYNLATDRLINFAPDQPNQTYFGGGPNGQPPGLRQSYGLNAFVAGVISASNDENTGETIAVPDSLKQLSLLDLQNLKTPFGLTYLSYAQMIGPLWGLS